MFLDEPSKRLLVGITMFNTVFSKTLQNERCGDTSDIKLELNVEFIYKYFYFVCYWCSERNCSSLQQDSSGINFEC